MSHVSPRERSDRFAGTCARLALRSERESLDIAEICEGLGCPLPVSDDDLRSLSLLCERWGIRCNMDDETASTWRTCRATRAI